MIYIKNILGSQPIGSSTRWREVSEKIIMGHQGGGVKKHYESPGGGGLVNKNYGSPVGGMLVKKHFGSLGGGMLVKKYYGSPGG